MKQATNVALPLIPAVLAACALSGTLLAQPSIEPPPSHTADFGFDSGPVSYSGDGSGPQVMYSVEVRADGATWLRLRFGTLVLAGDPARDDRTFVRITSTLDGASQVLDAETADRWSNTSAYFNGDSVFVEVIGFPGNGGGGESRITIPDATAGEPVLISRTICGSADDRALSSDPRSARFLPSGCSSWLINDENHQFLTAGHCGVGSNGVCQFNVPLSGTDGSLRHPGPEDQYPVESTSIQFANVGLGNDYTYFGCWPNTTTNQSAYQRQGSTYVLAASVPNVSGQTLRITGFGTTSSPVSNTWNQVQKTHTGAYAQKSGTILYYRVDTTGGNSGSAIENLVDGTAIGIHTNGGCGVSSGNNAGCSLDNPGLRNALANPRGICRAGFGQVVPPVFVGADSAQAFGSVSYVDGNFTRVSVLGTTIDGLAYSWNSGRFFATSTDRKLYSIDPATGVKTLIASLTGVSASVAGLGYDPWTDSLYGILQASGRPVRINTTTGVTVGLGAAVGGNIGALDFDPISRTLFGIDDAAGGSRLVRLDPIAGTLAVVGSLGAGIADCNGLAFNMQDQMLYTINAATEQLLRVNPATGVATGVGGTSTTFGASFGLACVMDRPCPGDFNHDGATDFFDYDEFVRCYEGAGCPSGTTSDYNLDGSTDFFDYDEFVVAFETSC
ncbi:MAG: DUF4394 domain-containing protein [Planctomycetota bacterium]